MAEEFEGITQEVFNTFWDVQYGRSNPERMDNPLWQAIAQDRATDEVYSSFRPKSPLLKRAHNTWRFNRTGMSVTLLEDRSLVFIGGSYEEESDFAVYNDVIIRRWDGSFEFYGYPKSDFAPTNYHSATFVQHPTLGPSIYIIGSLGLPSDRRYGSTPIYRLDLATKQIHQETVQGIEPGWIHQHEARLIRDSHEILIWSGEIQLGKSNHLCNFDLWAYSILDKTWRKTERGELLRLVYEDPTVTELQLSYDELALLEEYLAKKRASADLKPEEIKQIMNELYAKGRGRSSNEMSGWTCVIAILLGVGILASFIAFIWKLLNAGVIKP